MRIPGHLTVVMGVDINKAGCHRQTTRVDLFACLAFHLPHRHDSAIAHRDVAFHGRRPAAVDNQTTPNDQVIHGRHPFIEI